MSYLELALAGHEKGHSYIEDYEAPDDDTLAFSWGDRLLRPLDPSTRLLMIAGKHTPDILDNPLSWIVISTRFKEYISEWAPSSVQFVPAPIHRADSSAPVTGFWICNVINVVDCIDWERSKFVRTEEGDVDRFHEMWIRSSDIAGEVIFRPKSAESCTIVSEAFAVGLRGRGLLGIAFLRHRFVSE